MSNSGPSTGGGYSRFRVRSSTSHDDWQLPSPKRPRLNTDGPDSSSNASGHAESACLRCRKRKKRCCRTLPQCTACDTTGVQCSYPSSDNLSITVAEVNELRAQIERLSQQNVVKNNSNSNSYVLSPADTFKSGSLGNGPDNDQEDTLFLARTTEANGSNHSWNWSPDLGHTPRPPSNNLRLPAGLAVRELVDGYFRHVHKAYPFLDQGQVLKDIDDATTRPGNNSEGLSPLIYMLSVIGCITLHRAGKLSDDILASIKVPYEELIGQCMLDPSIHAVGMLLLLACYSTFDPTGICPWIVIGLAGRQAIVLGLNRKSTRESGLTLQEVEQRNRLFWSIYALDREVAASFGLPPSINDENINVPLPSVTIDEYASATRVQLSKVLQVCRNSIALRDLEGKILQKVHLANPISTLNIGMADRQAIVSQFVSQLDDWYANGCLLSQSENDEISFHDNIPWLNARYHGVLILLHYPSRFNAYYCREQLSSLRESIRRCVQCSAVLLQQQHLMLHHNTLNKVLVICLLLVFCLMQGNSEVVQVGEVRQDVSSCIDILEDFTGRWTLAKRSLIVFRDLERLLPTIRPGAGHKSPTTIESLRRVQSDAQSLIRDGLGPSSVYNNLYPLSVDPSSHSSGH
ncbi:fungal-specific transcription factor domain-containing protein [Exophiala viscosa]|uniref:Fungal-specific transcription factor domain-containing protein n=1 Tax=Exophiala viscosa TaxID=2486360 RepID=A0AAN6IHX9_9EURO|nr:fungal-specific transcription factor domain-containing protein [Exophiala viscosa]